MKIRTHRELRVWQNAMDAAMVIFEETKAFPLEERYSLVDQMRKSSRSVAANISEASRRRRYEAAFVNKLNEAESEASETQTWIEFSLRCEYLQAAKAAELDGAYETIVGQLVWMIQNPQDWVLDGQAANQARRRGEEQTGRGADRGTRRRSRQGDGETRGHGDG